MELSEAQTIFKNVQGTRFCGIDSKIIVSRLKRDEAVQPGVLTKITKGSSVMVFAQEDPTAYSNQVKRRMEKEGLDPTSWEGGPLPWGEWMGNSPFIVHTKKDKAEPNPWLAVKETYYLRVHFVHAGTSEYFLDGRPIAKSDIVDTSAPKKVGKQGGQEDKVIPRNFKLSSLTAIRIDGVEYKV